MEALMLCTRFMCSSFQFLGAYLKEVLCNDMQGQRFTYEQMSDNHCSLLDGRRLVRVWHCNDTSPFCLKTRVDNPKTTRALLHKSTDWQTLKILNCDPKKNPNE